MGERDVVFVFFGVSWAFAVQRGFMFSGDRLARALLDHPAVGRLLVCNPYRSVLGRPAAILRGRKEAPFSSSATAHLHAPLRLGRVDPADLAPTVARYEAGVRRAAQRHGLEQPVVISTDPAVAGFGGFD